MPGRMGSALPPQLDWYKDPSHAWKLSVACGTSLTRDGMPYAGLMYVQLHQAPRALPYYQEAVRLEPGNAALLANLASVLMEANRPADAEAAARRAVQLAPSSPE